MTQLTFAPRLTVTSWGMNVKFRIRMTTVPAAAAGILHWPAIGSGPAVVFSEKQLANGTLTSAAMMSAAAAVFRASEVDLLNVFPSAMEVHATNLLCGEQ